MSNLHKRLAILLLLAAAAWACSNPSTPSSPSSATEGAVTGSSAGVNGTGTPSGPGDGGNMPGGAGTGISGAVFGVSGSCPALTFTVAGKTVKTNSATRFMNGVCTGVTNGAQVGVRGTGQTDGSILAAVVHVGPPPGTPPPAPRPSPGPNPAPGGVGISGAVAGVSGSCPALTFTVAGKTVKTNSATQFMNGVCAGVTNGAQVGVRGTGQTDGSILAAVVHLGRTPRQ